MKLEVTACTSVTWPRGGNGTVKGDNIRDGTVWLPVQGGEPWDRQEAVVVSSFLLWLLWGRKQFPSTLHGLLAGSVKYTKKGQLTRERMYLFIF